MLIKNRWPQYTLHRMQRMTQNNVCWKMTQIDKLNNNESWLLIAGRRMSF